MKEQLLTIHNLEKTYYTKTAGYPVLRKINMTVSKGEFVAVMGPSGSGKTTLLNIISGFLSADSGEIKLKDKDLLNADKDEMADIRQTSLGFIFQDFMLIEGLSVKENVYLPQIIAGKENSLMENTTESLMEKFGINNIGDKYPSEISGGQKQRAAISRALSNNPLLILADEPTGALNSASGKQVLDILTELNEEGKSIVMVTHDIKACARGSRLLFLEDGRIAEDLSLGKYRKEDQKEREEIIFQYLKKNQW